jgi:hypothetical protein
MIRPLIQEEMPVGTSHPVTKCDDIHLHFMERIFYNSVNQLVQADRLIILLMLLGGKPSSRGVGVCSQISPNVLPTFLYL